MKTIQVNIKIVTPNKQYLFGSDPKAQRKVAASCLDEVANCIRAGANRGSIVCDNEGSTTVDWELAAYSKASLY